MAGESKGIVIKIIFLSSVLLINLFLFSNVNATNGIGIYVAKGIGIRPCSEIIEQQRFEKRMVNLDNSELQWALGFLSSYNYFVSKKKDVDKSLYPANVGEKILTYCSLHPKEKLVQATISLLPR